MLFGPPGVVQTHVRSVQVRALCALWPCTCTVRAGLAPPTLVTMRADLSSNNINIVNEVKLNDITICTRFMEKVLHVGFGEELALVNRHTIVVPAPFLLHNVSPFACHLSRPTGIVLAARAHAQSATNEFRDAAQARRHSPCLHRHWMSWSQSSAYSSSRPHLFRLPAMTSQATAVSWYARVPGHQGRNSFCCLFPLTLRNVSY
jgi:hypothetical protein